jgi:hypothetical protein
MLQLALPVQHSTIAFGEGGVHAAPKARTLAGALIGNFMRLMRWLGEFAAAGGPLT